MQQLRDFTCSSTTAPAGYCKASREHYDLNCKNPNGRKGFSYQGSLESPSNVQPVSLAQTSGGFDPASPPTSAPTACEDGTPQYKSSCSGYSGANTYYCTIPSARRRNWAGDAQDNCRATCNLCPTSSPTAAPTTEESVSPFLSGKWLGDIPAYEYLNGATRCGANQVLTTYQPLGASGNRPDKTAQCWNRLPACIKCREFPSTTQFEANLKVGSECQQSRISYINGQWSALAPVWPGDVSAITKWCTIANTAQFLGTFSSSIVTRNEGYHSTCCGTDMGANNDNQCRFEATPICTFAKVTTCTKCPHTDCGDQASGQVCSVRKRAELKKVCFEKTTTTGKSWPVSKAWACNKGLPSSRQCYTLDNIPSEYAGTSPADNDWCNTDIVMG